MRTKHLPGFFVLILLFASCPKPPEKKQPLPFVSISGFTQGTSYHFTFDRMQNDALRSSIDSLLHAIDHSLSHYTPNSIISRLNRNDSAVVLDSIFREVFQKSTAIAEETDGAFDFTIAPLVEAWGFLLKTAQPLSPGDVARYRGLVDFRKVSIQGDKLIKANQEIKLDFNAIAQGYSVDRIAGLLEATGVKNYMVEIGGEVRVSGKNKHDQSWQIGIDKPADSAFHETRSLQAVVRLQNQSISTSGNYRKYYIKNGRKISHTIDPKTGYPVNHNLLSASIIAPSCAQADAFATACMVMGLEKSMQWLKQTPETEAFLIFEDSSGEMAVRMTDGFKALLVK